MKNTKWIGFLLLLSAAFLPSCRQADNSGKVTEICNVSYDPTRELYAEYGRVFEKHWLEKTGEVITVEDTHAGSGAQSRAVRDGGKVRQLPAAVAGQLSGGDIILQSAAAARAAEAASRGGSAKLTHIRDPPVVFPGLSGARHPRIIPKKTRKGKGSGPRIPLAPRRKNG